MKLRSRISLIVSGIILFAFLAPAAILLARGYRFDSVNARLIKTGTLVIRSEPRGAKILLNEKSINSTTPIIKRFILPGEYRIELQKKNYHPWKKRINVHESQVTEIFPSSNKAILFLTTPQTMTVSTTTTEISTPTSTSTNGSYYISTPSNHLKIKSSLIEDPMVLPEALPLFSKSEIIATPTRQLFLLLDQNLYQVKENLQLIQNAISYVAWNPEMPGLIYGNDHEIWIFNENQQKSFLVTRSFNTLGPAQYNPKSGNIFVAEENKILAIELDSFGEPNIYTLVESESRLPKFHINPEGTQLTYNSGLHFITLKIR